MTRGCELEKRCHACRIFGVSQNDKMPFEIVRFKFILKENMSTFKNICFYPQEEMMKTIASWYVFPEYHNGLEVNMLKEEVSDMIDTALLAFLNEREQTVIRMRFGLLDDESDRSLEEIAKELNVTRERVRQIESSAIKKLKHPKVGRVMKDYIDI